MIDFSLPPELAALQARVEPFVRDVVIPAGTRGEDREELRGGADAGDDPSAAGNCLIGTAAVAACRSVSHAKSDIRRDTFFGESM